MDYYRNVQPPPSWKRRQPRSSRKSRKAHDAEERELEAMRMEGEQEELAAE